MKIIGISGYAGSGKDSFANLLEGRLKSTGKTFFRGALADKLKEETRPIILESTGIDVLNCSRDEKSKLRDFIVAYSETLIKKFGGKQIWIEKFWEDVKDKNVDYLIITDVRFPEEVEFIRDQESESIILYVEKIGNEPPNESEKENIPIVEKHSDYQVVWDSFNDISLDDVYVIVDNFLEFLFSCGHIKRTFLREKIRNTTEDFYPNRVSIFDFAKDVLGAKNLNEYLENMLKLGYDKELHYIEWWMEQFLTWNEIEQES